MKLEELVDPSFKSGVTKLATAGLPMKVAFKLEGIVGAIEEELKKFEVARQAALKKYGKLKEDGSCETDDKGNVIFKDEDSAKSFIKEYTDLAAQEVAIGKLNLNDFGDNVKITVEELRKLKPILEV